MGPSNFISRGKCLFPLGDCDKSYTKYVVITEVCTGKPCRLLHGEALPLESCNWAEKYVGNKCYECYEHFICEEPFF